MDDVPVVLRQRQPHWVVRFIWICAAALVVMVVLRVTLLDRPAASFLSLLPFTGFVVLGVGILVRRPRIEVHDDALVVRSLRTTRIPYEQIASVHGDVPSRLDWSTHLVVEREGGRAVALPPVETALAEVRDLVMRRAGLH